MKLPLLTVIVAGLTAVAQAAPVAPPVRAEIDALLSRLQASGCQFSRNGSWYSGEEAKTHLLRKLDYLEGKNMVQSTEQFIALGASASSSSGKPYLVRCAGAAPVDSAAWLNGELKARRAANPPKSP